MLLPCHQCPSASTWQPRPGQTYAGTRTCPPGQACPLNHRLPAANSHSVSPKAPSSGGVGTELAALLKELGIDFTETCGCRRHVRDLDRHGVAWAINHVPEIVGWLRGEWERRKTGIEFDNSIAELTVREAIARANAK